MAGEGRRARRETSLGHCITFDVGCHERLPQLPPSLPSLPLARIHWSVLACGRRGRCGGGGRRSCFKWRRQCVPGGREGGRAAACQLQPRSSSPPPVVSTPLLAPLTIPLLTRLSRLPLPQAPFVPYFLLPLPIVFISLSRAELI